MRGFVALIMLLFGFSSAGAQSGPVNLDSLLNEVNLDSLTSYVEHLSGGRGIQISDTLFVFTVDTQLVPVADTMVYMPDRWHVTNDVATEYIARTLESFGLDSISVDQDPVRPWLKNVVGFKFGDSVPDEWYIICAHYDGVRNAPAADDNGSGTAAVLEAARLLSNLQPHATVVFALWDSEEIGLLGSRLFRNAASDSGQVIRSVVNLDMIGWDGDDDHVVEIHTDFQSSFIANEVARAVSNLSLDLEPVIRFPGTRASDHSRFWDRGYPAVLLIEEFRGGDFNPHYHSPSDSVAFFNLDYFREMARLAVAMIASFGFDTSFQPIVHAKASLLIEGAYSAAGAMSVPTLFKNSRPFVQPYASAVFDGTDLEVDDPASLSVFPDSAIDWVVASLRSALTPAAEVPGSRRAAILMSRGTVVDTTGLMLSFPGVPPAPYYLVIGHRNHASVMSADTVDTGDGHGQWDFTESMQSGFTGGPNPMRRTFDGWYSLFAGDATFDGQITTNDFNEWLIDTKAVATGYLLTDFDLDGQVTTSDFNLWLQNTKAVASSQVP